MRELSVRIPAEALEEVLDALLPLAPRGVHEASRAGEVELRLRGAEPPRAEVQAAVAPWGVRVEECSVSDDWRERRAADFEPLLLNGRLAVRPDWAPAPDADVVDIVLAEGSAFGTGGHPTTRACLDLLLTLEPRGSFADLGCGSGVLAIAASKLGWAPVVAVDVDEASVEATTHNSRVNDARVEARAADLAVEAPPGGATVAANVPAALHAELSGRLGRPEHLVISGVQEHEAQDVIAAYARHGLGLSRRLERGGWVVALLEPCARGR
jgi:ribosomal protein L11 methyltransferase